MDALRVFINELFLKSFDTIFMRNIKSCQKINFLNYFFLNFFLKINVFRAFVNFSLLLMQFWGLCLINEGLNP